MKENNMSLINSLKEKLPYRYVELILDNMDDPEQINSSHFMPIESELMSLFPWELSNEGYDFWNEVHLFLIELGDLPFIPIDIDYKEDTMFYADGSVHIMNLANAGLCIKFKIEGADSVESITPELKEKVLGILN